ncbi:MAG: helix-turn-helix domain-containing protein [Lentimicrobium sp.]|nr:helix-turn-helix domain-containing protein [Lentimicrobium sp.]
MTGGRINDSRFIERLTEVITANLTIEQFGVTELAQEMGVSRSFIHRHLKKHTNQSISQFIRTVRLEKAMEMLFQGDESASEIAFKTGFGSPAYFNHCFHEHFGFPPGEARKRYLNDPESINTGKNSETIRPVSSQLPKTGWMSQRRNLVLSLFAVFLFLVLFSLIYFGYNKAPVSEKQIAGAYKSVVVLPFKNLSPDAENQYFADGIAEDILNHLSRFEELRVISRTSSEQFREGTHSAAEISRKLNVNYILEGSVRREDEKIRISVQFIEARTDRHLWAENYDRQLADVFAIQSDIAQKVANALQFVLSPAEKQQMEKIPTKNTEAYNYYLMGRFFWNKRTEDGMKKSVEYFEKAISADPDYAKAYAGLADAFFIQTWWIWEKRPDGYEMAKQMALKALELDNNLAEAWATLGSILCYSDWEWEESRKMLKKAIELNPNYAIARQYYSELLEILNEKDEALEQIDKAIEIDPLFFMYRILKSGYNYRAGKYDEALEARLESEELYPGYSSRGYYYFLIYYKLGKDQKAIESLQKILANDNTTIKFVNTATDVYSDSGMNGILNLIIDLEKQKVPSNYLRIANWYCLLGEKEPALNWLERAVEERVPDIPRMNCSQDLNILRDEPRFNSLIEKMGLSPYANLTEK